MDVPCYITVHNLLTWTVPLVSDCRRLGLRPVVCDHGSTYQPLLDWYATCPCEVRRFDNHGPHGFFNRKDHEKQSGLYVHTDCDLDLSGVPDDAIKVMLAAWDANPWATKIGLSLETDGIPDALPWAADVKGWESNHWNERTPDGHWRAGVDGTFALYDQARKNLSAPGTDFYRGVRLDRPYTARHLPWYLTAERAGDPEFAGYFGNPSAIAHWSPRIGRDLGLGVPSEREHMTAELPEHLRTLIEGWAPLPGWASQDKMRELASIVLGARPALVVEAGVFGGRSALPQIAALAHLGSGRFVAIDPYRPDVYDEGEKTPEEAWMRTFDYAPIRDGFLAEVAKFGYEPITTLVQERARDVADQFADGEIGVFHLDGCHYADVALADAKAYWPKIAPGGTIVVDDTNWYSLGRTLDYLSEVGAELIVDRETYRVYRKPLA